MGMPVVMTQGYRSPEDQTEMFVRGESPLPEWRSRHNWGLALNFEHQTLSFDLMDEKQLKIIDQVANEVARSINAKVIWGQESNPRHWSVFVPPTETWRIPISPPAWAKPLEPRPISD